MGALLARADGGFVVTAHPEFRDVAAGVNDRLNTMNVLNWNARTPMPAGGHKSRGHQLSTLSGLA
jgi:carboxypeptidase Taq